MTLRAPSPWLLVVLLACGLLCSLGYGSCQGRRADSAERAAQAAHLEADGFEVAVESGKRDLEAARRELEQLPALKAERERLEAEVGRLTTALTAALRTSPVAARGIPRPPAAQVAAPGVPLLAPGAAPACPPCLLAEGDVGEVRCSILGSETREGVLVIQGQGEAWRLRPEPATPILSGTFDARLGEVRREVEAVPRNWAARAGVSAPWGYWAGVDRRVWGRLWLGGDLAVTDHAEARLGVRWEF